MTPRARLLLAVLAAASVPPAARADVYVLKDGDRITGKTVVKGPASFAVQTPYGRLTIPRAKVDRILHDDGKEEILNPPPEPAPAPPEPPRLVQLVVVITGKIFWYAWDPPKGATVDPTLRLEASLDEQTLATYVDARLDPGEIPGAMVNAFGFRPDEVAAIPAADVQAQPPEARPGRIALKLDLPREKAGRRRLRLAYQANEGTEAQPAWRDISAASVDIELTPDTPRLVQVQQDPGRMEFSGPGRKQMKYVDTFKLQARAE